LQARVALEALVGELPSSEAGALGELRSSVAEAAGAALRGELDAAETASIEEAVRAMEAALRRHRLRG
jgi:hypothetical protein